ncbi:HEAT repeat domain-containing protein [Acetatifactor aquisgranensis]|uniref:HEAT repeat domain-containing protein n=1 Tax=Acetatifactor aquisgranensis TaxID=2941233 RepID=UPI002040CDC0|nr:HEAT repeat domain-containing protein [Acetatifactor aquisgranensis]MCI8541823.1 HEAT repeat domain-containing protein [Lachnospiraceae bacterium]
MGKLEKIEKLASKGKADKLLGFVGDKDKEVRLAAIASVSGMIENEDVRNTVVGLTEDADPDIRKAAITALGSGRGSYVETRLRYCLTHEKDENVLQAVRAALENIKK